MGSDAKDLVLSKIATFEFKLYFWQHKDSMDSLMKERTVLVIAYRLSTVKTADIVLRKISTV
ncbi:hypothetical protein TorRG33x02_115790 [Trema orientale]|uniref:P-loop containing nucleoside triphosphate hydrolase n=1 Tax=Trema orientale TaxID=63057 RepID=A0A2P5F4Q7_TREOI|nr:hypothetical protein TorRG33x02_115790 [Trema orientale]